MEIEKLGETDAVTLPVPVFESLAIAKAVSKDGTKFTVRVGLDEKMANELKQYSLDENDVEVQKKTSDRRRFGEGSYKTWYEKDRTPFALTDDATGALAALVWFGPETPPGGIQPKPGTEWHTLAYRSYGQYRGKGLMKDFTRFTIEFYETRRPMISLWTAIHADNAASIALSEKLGFKTVPEVSDEKNVTMVRI